MDHTTEDFAWLEGQLDDHPHAIFFAALSGSHLYGFPSGDSDFDVRGAHLLPLDELLGLERGPETVERFSEVDGREVDLVTHDLEKFIRLLLDKNAMMLEQICSPHLICAEGAFDELRDIARDCVTRHHVHHYLGLARSSWESFEETLRLKDLLYAYRGCLSGMHAMRAGGVESNLATLASAYDRPHVYDLLEAKRAGSEKMQMPEEDVSRHRPLIEALIGELEEEFEASELPERIPSSARERLDDLLVRVRLQRVE